MANKKLTEVTVVSTLDSADYLFANQNAAIRQIKKSDISFPNPNALTFTGAATGSYDGSSPIEINIPDGGGTDVTVDTTLSVAGQAADAKATGDKFGELKEDLKDKVGWAKVTGSTLYLYADKAMTSLIQTVTLPSGGSGGGSADGNTTYTFAISGNVITVTDSDGGEQTITLPSAVTDSHINSLIDAKLGVIENGTY